MISVPLEYAPWFPDVNEFALTFNAYDRFGSPQKIAAVARFGKRCYLGDGTFLNDLDLLRTCLFYEQRRWHHLDGDPYEEPETREYVKALLRTIMGSIRLGSANTCVDCEPCCRGCRSHAVAEPDRSMLLRDNSSWPEIEQIVPSEVEDFHIVSHRRGRVSLASA